MFEGLAIILTLIILYGFVLLYNVIGILSPILLCLVIIMIWSRKEILQEIK